MNLYMIFPNSKYFDATEYDTYDGAVVAAESISDAKKIHPNSADEEVGKGNKYEEWPTSVLHVKATLIGKAKEGTKRGVILASFNAG